MSISRTPWPPLGATPRNDGLVDFRVWAEKAETVRVHLGSESHPLQRAGGGIFEGSFRAVPGSDYLYELDGRPVFPDPCSRSQPLGLRGPSRVVSTAAFPWTDGDWRGL